MSDNMKNLYRTREQLEKILLENIRSILRSNVTAASLTSPHEMTYGDIIGNFHLCERLSNAHGALCALKGYGQPDNKFVLSALYDVQTLLLENMHGEIMPAEGHVCMTPFKLSIGMRVPRS